MTEGRLLAATTIPTVVISVAVLMTALPDGAFWSPGVKYDVTPLVSLALPPTPVKTTPPPIKEVSTPPLSPAPPPQKIAAAAPVRISPKPQRPITFRAAAASSRHPPAPPPPATPIVRVESRALAPPPLNQ